jgi:hypothetical protein
MVTGTVTTVIWMALTDLNMFISVRFASWELALIAAKNSALRAER